MVFVLKIDGLVDNVKPGDIRRYFKDNGVRPEDIHVTYPNGARDGLAFLIFNERRDADDGLKANGSLFLGRRINVRNSTPKEFNGTFPGVPMLTRNLAPPANTRSTNNASSAVQVIKVERLEAKTSKIEIRKFFKERGVYIDDIHTVPGDRNTALAFLIFTSRKDAESALKVNGCYLRSSKIYVRVSTPGEFNKYFPRIPMLQRGAAPANDVNPIHKVGVMKVDNIHFQCREVDVRHHFKDQGAKVTDIHFIIGPNGRHKGTAFVVLSDRGELDNALHSDGTYLQGRKLTVIPSSPKEFNQYFPKIDLAPKIVHDVGRKTERNRDSFGSSRKPNERSTRDRSRSPHRNDYNDSRQSIFDDVKPAATGSDQLSKIDQDKFLRMSGLPYDVGMTQVVTFFQPIQVREVFLLKHSDGKYAGETNGSAVVEFFSKSTAQKALQDYDGRTLSQRLISLRYASKEDISRALNIPATNDVVAQAFSSVQDLQLSGGNNNPQLQNLLTLLTATVTAMSGQQQQQQQQQPQQQQQRTETTRRGERNSNSVVNRVASSANVDVTDIKRGCVIGIRNLHYSVTPDDILKFFHGFHVIADSVRIHYLNDGRCSGDAIVSFRSNRDARNAVSALNRKNILHRRIELFFL